MRSGRKRFVMVGLWSGRRVLPSEEKPGFMRTLSRANLEGWENWWRVYMV